MVFTFYSFKGGVGRSMGMATVGFLLAQRGLKVLVIDFDLEAPGLERYFFDEPGQLAEIRSNPGLVDLVLAYKRALTSEAEFQRAEFKNLPAFIVQAIPRTPKGGSVDLMTAGRRHPEDRYSAYALAVRGFDWQDFFHNWRGGRFFEWLRAELVRADRGYDAVLVDSRTGVTEMGGVCAYQLADVAVLMCAPNYQNLDGTRAVVADFRSDAVMALRGGRPLEILVLPSRVEQSDPVKRDRFFDDLELTFGTHGLPKVLADAGLDYRRLAVPYRPELAIIERLVDEMATGSGGALAAHSEARASFETLTDALTLIAKGERWGALKQEAVARLAGRTSESATGPVADVTRRSAGYDAFVECHLRDREQGAALVKALAARQLEIWLEPEREPELDPEFRAARLRALEYSHALIVCIGGSGPSPEYWNIVREAQRHRKPLIPVLVAGVENAGDTLERYGLSNYQAVDLSAGISPAVDSIVEVLGRERPVSGAESREAPTPYPGGAAFSEDQSAYFQERDNEIDALLNAFVGGHVTLLEGPAGVGKTSLVQAGFLPRVRRAEHPFTLASGETAWTVVTIDAAAPGALETLDHLDRAQHAPPVLCVLDGIDSFPLDGRDEARRHRVERIDRLLRRAQPRHFFLLVWRGSLPETERTHAIERWQADRSGSIPSVSLQPLTAEALRAAIEKPAAAVGHLFEPGLVDRLLSDAGNQAGAVAQVQLALSDIWASRTRGWLTNKAYDSAGGIGGRFAIRLGRTWTEHQETRGDALGTLLKNLVQLDAGVSVVPSSREWSELASIPAIADHDAVAVRDVLAQERLIDLWRDAQDRLLCGLAQPLPGQRLESLAQAEADFVLWRQRFTTHVHQYTRNGRVETAMVTGVALGEAEYWLSQKADQLPADERELIARSQQMARQRDAAELERHRQENERLTVERDRAEREGRRAEVERRRAVTRAHRLKLAAVLLVAIGAGLGWLLNVTRNQREQLALQAAVLGARRLAAIDPTAGAVGIAAALEGGGSPEFVLRAIYSLPGAPMAKARLVHDAEITHAAFLPEGSGFLTAAGNSVRLWTMDGKLRAPVPAMPDSQLVAVAFIAGPAPIVTAWSNGTLRSLNVEGRVVEEFSSPVAASFGAFSRDGRLLSTTAEEGPARVRDLQGRVLAEINARTVGATTGKAITRTALSPDGAHLVTVAGDQTRVWDVATRRGRLIVVRKPKVVGAPESPDPEYTSVVGAAFSGDGSRIVTWEEEDGIARVWDVNARLIVAQLGSVRDDPRHSAKVHRAVFSRDGRRIATASADGIARVWDAEGNLVAELKGHTASIGSVEFGPDPGSMTGDQVERSTHLLLTISDDRTARVWDDTGRTVAELRGHAEPLLDGRFDPTGKWVLTTSRDRTARLWGLQERLEMQLPHSQAVIADIAVSRDGRRAVTAPHDGVARVWDLQSGSDVALEPHENRVVHAAFSPDGQRVVTASYDNTARISDWQGKTSIRLVGHEDWVQDAAFSPDGQRVITASSDRTARVWDLQGHLVERLEGHTDAVLTTAFSPDGRRILTASADRTARLWNIQAAPSSSGNRSSSGPARLDRVLAGHDGAVFLAVFSPDARILTASADGTARVWDLDGRPLTTLAGPAGGLTSAAFSLDGRQIVTSSDDGTARIWDAQGKQLSVLRAPASGRVHRAEFNPDGTWIATASEDRTARVWHRDGRLIAELRGHTGVLTRAAFTPGGDYLLTTSWDGTARAWPLTASAFRARMSSIAMPCLNQLELQDYLLVEPGAAEKLSTTCSEGRGLGLRP